MSTCPRGHLIKYQAPAFISEKKYMKTKISNRIKIFKVVILFSGFCLSILTIVLIADTLGIRSYGSGGSTSNILVVPPAPKKSNTNNYVTTKGKKNNAKSISRKKPQDSITLQPISLLFKVDKPADFNIKDPKILETDFFDQLNTINARTEAFVGIYNKGNSCYADSVLQMLYRHPVVRKIVANAEIYYELAVIRVEQMTQRTDKSAKTELERDDLITAVSVLEGLNHMFHQLHNNKNDAATFRFKKSMQCMPGQFASTDQEDADEYFTKIMGFIKDLLPASQHYHFAFGLVQGGTVKNASKTEKRADKSELQFKLSLVLDDCRDLNCLLNKYFADEIVNDVKFSYDDTLGTLVITKRLSKLPDILPIQLQRLTQEVVDGTFDTKKNSNSIKMPVEIDFRKWLVNSKESAKYRLKMFVKHLGDSTGGHYVAYSLESDGKWYLLDDSSVSEIYYIESEINSSYYYYYERLRI